MCVARYCFKALAVLPHPSIKASWWRLPAFLPVAAKAICNITGAWPWRELRLEPNLWKMKKTWQGFILRVGISKQVKNNTSKLTRATLLKDSEGAKWESLNTKCHKSSLAKPAHGEVWTDLPRNSLSSLTKHLRFYMGGDGTACKVTVRQHNQ